MDEGEKYSTKVIFKILIFEELNHNQRLRLAFNDLKITVGISYLYTSRVFMIWQMRCICSFN